MIALVCGGTVLFMLSGMTAMIRSRFSTPTIGREELIGEMGVAEVDVAPDGVVKIHEALWRARTNRATPITAGDEIRVVAVEGIVLEVEPREGGAKDYRDRSGRARVAARNPLLSRRLCQAPGVALRSAAVRLAGGGGDMVALGILHETWHLNAACRGPESALFFPPTLPERREERELREARAKAICAQCDVRQDCLEFALRVREPHGIWGGLTEAERRRRLPDD